MTLTKTSSKLKLGLFALAAFGMTTIAAGSADAKPMRGYRGKHVKSIKRGKLIKTPTPFLKNKTRAAERDFHAMDKNNDGVITKRDFLVRVKAGTKWKRTWKRTKRGWKRGWKRVAVYKTIVKKGYGHIIASADFNGNKRVTMAEYKRALMGRWVKQFAHSALYTTTYVSLPSHRRPRISVYKPAPTTKRWSWSWNLRARF